MSALRVLVVVQRYGVEVNGGAEQHARWLAESLANRGHDVHVLTTCARDYTSWSNYYDARESTLNGVRLHRCRVDAERDMDEFNSFSERLDFTGYSHPTETEIRWLELQGPSSAALDTWLVDHGATFDVVVPFTYLYRPSHHVIHRLSGVVPIVMHATAHDEPPFHLRLIQNLIGRVDRFLCSTPEEAHLLTSCLGPQTSCDVVGIGVPGRLHVDADGELAALGLGDTNFVLILGRVDGSKGVIEAVDLFRQFRRHHGVDLHLVVAGQNVAGLASDDAVTMTGFVSDDQVTALLQRARCLIQPSRFESFSLVLCEAWASGTPTLVTAGSDVLVGHTQRSRGGLIYHDADSFDDALLTLANDPERSQRFGMSGRRYVQALFSPDVVTSRIENMLRAAVAGK